jgi:hypothetical protein
MGRFLAIIVFASITIVQLSFAEAKSLQKPATSSAPAAESAPDVGSALPPIPSGKSTVIGGAIRAVDPVRDQITLKVFGGRSMKILFDERTQFYRDGTRTSLRDLRPEDHASVQTVLDGTNVFAISIHILSQPPQGELQGQVLNFDPGTRQLAVSSALSHQSITVRVPPGTPVVRVGQAASASAESGASDFVKGTLVSVEFKSGNNGQGVATKIAVLATPGSVFVFSGNITFLDLHAGVLALVDPRDGKTYKISFDPSRFPTSRDLHEGAHVSVTTDFVGTRYVASAIKVN